MTTRRDTTPEGFRASTAAFAANVVAAFRDVNNEPSHRAEAPSLRLFWAVATFIAIIAVGLIVGAWLP